MSLTPCLDDDTLAQLVAGLLSPEGLDHVDQHLVECANCSWLVAVGAPPFTDASGNSPFTASNTPRFELREQIGEGAMGVVYRAHDRWTGNTVAIKRWKGSSEADFPGGLRRFGREMAILERLAHPNIVRLVQLSTSNELPELVMEYVPGGSLRACLRAQGVLPIERAVSILLELSDALSRAHHQGVIHRDLKPENVLMAADGSPRLADFGLARLAASSCTSADQLIGTLPYMSPEALSGAAVDEKSDLWALGVLAFELLAGQRPFHGAPPAAVVGQILKGRSLDLQALRPEVPAALVQLVYALLRQDAAERPTARAVGAALEALRGRPGRITTEAHAWLGSKVEQQRAGWATFPQPTVPFIGRGRELAELCALLLDADTQLITLLGPGGTGKSRLGIEAARRLTVAQRFTGGAYFVDLTLIASPELAATAIAAALALPLHPGGGAAEQLCELLRERSVLLVLDNFEHVLPAAALVHALLLAAPGVKVLATSREPLSLSIETRFALGGMHVPATEVLEASPVESDEASAVQLFLAHARRVRASFQLSEDPRGVLGICRLVEGMPLGIVLAASWVNLLSPSDILEEISRNLDFLRSDLRDLPARQRSSRAVFEHSFQLLGERGRSVCARLSLFRGGFDRVAAAAVCGARVDDLALLVDKSFLVWDPAQRRYHLHELLRQFAEAELRAGPDAQETLARFAKYFAHYLGEKESDLYGKEHGHALRQVLADWGNLRAAWHWILELGDLNAAEAAVHGLLAYHYRHGARAEAEQQAGSLASAFSARASEGDEQACRLVGMALTMQAGIAENQGQTRACRVLLQKALTLLAGTRDSRELGFALILSGSIPLPGRDDATAVSEARRGFAMYRSLSKPGSVAVALTWMARVHFEMTKDLAAAERCLRESIALQRAENAGEVVLPVSLNGLALVRASLGDWREAAELLQRSVTLSEQAEDRWALEEALRMTGWVRSSLGHFEEASAAARRCIAVCRETGAQESIIWGHFVLCDAALERGALDDAAAELEEAHALSAEGSFQRTFADIKLAQLALRRGRLREADTTLCGALVTAEASHRDWVIRAALSALGHVACEEKRYADARGYWLRELQLCEATDVPALVAALADLARLYARTGSGERALELLGALVGQASMVHTTRRWQVAPLLVELAESLPRPIVEAALLRGRAVSLHVCVRECLADGAGENASPLATFLGSTPSSHTH